MCAQFVFIPVNSKVNTPSWNTNISSATQEIPYILKIYCSAQTSSPLDIRLSHINSTHTLPYYVCKIYFNIIVI